MRGLSSKLPDACFQEADTAFSWKIYDQKVYLTDRIKYSCRSSQTEDLYLKNQLEYENKFREEDSVIRIIWTRKATRGEEDNYWRGRYLPAVFFAFEYSVYLWDKPVYWTKAKTTM